MKSFLPKYCILINALTCCANCGKEAAPFQLKMCTACRSVCYCDVDCQKNHRKNHKHQCTHDMQDLKKIKANLRTHQDTDDDDNGELLFQPIPPQDDCPICTLPLPIDTQMKMYMSCCGNHICTGCGREYVVATLDREQILCCAFCREPNPSSDNENIISLNKRMEKNDNAAIYNMSRYYKLGHHGLPKDLQKAFELCLRAVDLGNSEACNSAALFYKNGVVVPKNMAKAREYYVEAANKGSFHARHNLGAMEHNKGNHHIASKHWLISAAAGYDKSLEEIAYYYKMKFVTRKEYATTLASYVKVHKDEWSIERERAAADVAAAAAATL